MANDTRGTLPLRTFAAALVMGAGGWALARAVTIMLANISIPSFQHTVLPAKFSYGAPAGWSASAPSAWPIAIVCVLLLPMLVNRTWFSRRLLSAPGIVRLAAATLLVSLVATAALIGSDVFTQSPWGGGARLTLLAHVILIILAALGGGVLFALFGEGMKAGAPDAWIGPSAPRADVIRAFANGALAGVVVSLLAFVAADTFNLLFRALFGFLGESAEVSPLGWTRLELALTLGMGLLFAGCGALLVAMAPGGGGGSRRFASLGVAAVPAVALVALALWFRNYCQTTGEMNATFAQAAALESAPKPRLMLLPGSHVYPYAMEVVLPGWEEESVGATSGNIERADQYLRRLGGRWTAHTLAAWHTAPYVHDRLLEPEAALVARADAAEETGSLLSTMTLFAKISRMPRSRAVRDVSARLLDPAHFVGTEAGVRLKKDALVARDRTVTGTIALPEGARQGTRVALYQQVNGDPPSAVPAAMQLVAAAAVDARGRFTFDSLPPAFYSVGVLLSESLGSDPKRVTVEGALRVVDLSKDRKRDDAGTVRIFSR